MTHGEIFAHALAHATGKPLKEALEEINALCAAHPKIASGFSKEMPDAEAQEQIKKMAAEGPGVLLKLMHGFRDVAQFESNSVH